MWIGCVGGEGGGLHYIWGLTVPVMPWKWGYIWRGGAGASCEKISGRYLQYLILF